MARARKTKRRKKKFDFRSFVMLICALVGICCLGYFVMYCIQTDKSTSQANNLSNIKENNKFVKNIKSVKATVTLDDVEMPDMLEDYAGLVVLNKNTVGWIKIDGTQIDYPVLQTSNNDYYLNHNFDQDKDNNGSIFLDKDCSIWPRSQNLILYGHNMKSGKMFGSLKQYKDESFFEKHPTIQFDSIFEKGEYQIMYVFSDVVHDEIEVAFKYYQFINANSEVEYNSYMNEMANKSLYDTGVTSNYGDALITLSTCDYTADSERFVVVAKKVK